MTSRNTWISQRGESSSLRVIRPPPGCKLQLLAIPLFFFSVFGIYAKREIKHRVFFSRERQRGSHDLTFPAFAVCRRGGHFSRLEETRKREYLQLVCTDYCFIFIVYFCSYASRFGFPCVQVSFGICETMESWKIYNLDPEASESC